MAQRISKTQLMNFEVEGSEDFEFPGMNCAGKDIYEFVNTGRII
jgi:hypothetical protein